MLEAETMSFKSKDLHYDNAQPAFLQRLRGQLSGPDSDRHERPIARQKGQKKDDQDDAPTYVLEDSNQSITKEEYEALLKAETGEEGKALGDKVDEDEAKAKEMEKPSKKPEVGQASRKRKAVKVFGNKEEENEKLSKVKDAKVTKKPKKRAKAIKLSFDDPEEG